MHGKLVENFVPDEVSLVVWGDITYTPKNILLGWKYLTMLACWLDMGLNRAGL